MVTFEILIKKLQVEDTGAYQEMIRMNCKTFCEILVATLVILPFWFELFFDKTADRKTIIHHHPHVQTAKNYH